MSAAAVLQTAENGSILSNHAENVESGVYRADLLCGGIEIIERISAEWIELCEEGASNEPFFRPEWFSAFVENYEKEILLFTVRKAGKLRAVLPLKRTNGFLHGVPVRKLEGVFNLQSQRFDLVHGADETERGEINKKLWETIKLQSQWDVFEIRLVEKESWLGDLLKIAETENYKSGIWKMDGAPFVSLPTGTDKKKLIEEQFKSLKRHFRQDINRRLRRLNEIGEVEFVTTREYSLGLMRKYLVIEKQSWKGRRGTAAACDPKTEKLHIDFAREVATQNALTFYELKLDGETIAMTINITFAKKTVFWKTAFDENYTRFAPGHLLIREFTTDCIENDSMEIDMLSPSADYKKVWATGEREHFAFYIFRRGIVGSILQKWKFSVISYLRKYKEKDQKGGTV